jgi:hypothetical protein
MVGSRLSASFFKTSQTFRNVLIADVPLSLLVHPPAHPRYVSTFKCTAQRRLFDCLHAASCTLLQHPNPFYFDASRRSTRRFHFAPTTKIPTFIALFQAHSVRRHSNFFFFFCHTVELDCQLALDETTPFSAVLLNDD